MNLARIPASRIAHFVAICGFVGATLWTSRAVLEHPATDVGLGLPANPISVADVKQNIAQVSYISRTVWKAPLSLFQGQMCYPTATGVTLTEHMLLEGLVGLPAQLLWGDPVATFNSVVIVKPLIGAVSMYALAYYWTGSIAAALIAGFAFGFHPIRLLDRVHPSVVGNELIPAILLSLHLVFTRRRWRDVSLLVVVTALLLLGSVYVLMQIAIAGGIYGTYLLWWNRRTILELLPKLAVAATALTALAAAILGPYIETREVWGLLQGRAALPIDAGIILPGNRSYPGTCLLFLAVLGLLDRLHGARVARGYDPRVTMAVIPLVAFWFVFGWHVPSTECSVPSLRVLLNPWIPGLDAGRAPHNALFVAVIPLCLLAAYGVRVLGEKIGPRARSVVAGVVGIACVAEVFVPALATRSFGSPLPEEAYRIRPRERDLALLRNLPPGAVLNYPFQNRGWGILRAADGVLHAAYHEREAAVCMGSFRTPVQFEIEAIANRLPDDLALQDLWTLGFRTILFSGEILANRVIRGLADRAAASRLQFAGKGETLRVFEIVGGGSVTTDIGSLTPVVESELSAAAKDIDLRFGMRNGNSNFRHPDPVRPSELLVTWTRDGSIIQSNRRRALLPLVLTPGQTTELVIGDRVPTAPGFYVVNLTLPNGSSRVVGTRYIIVPPT